jgi:hypothetical protein
MALKAMALLVPSMVSNLNNGVTTVDFTHAALAGTNVYVTIDDVDSIVPVNASADTLKTAYTPQGVALTAQQKADILATSKSLVTLKATVAYPQGRFILSSAEPVTIMTA